MESVSDLTHHRIKTNGIYIHVAEKKGPGPFVLLLHGFPETWFSWHNQIRDLASHGYHVVAPDLRGYGDSDSPPSPSSYTMFHIVADLIGLLDHFNQQQFQEPGRAERAFAKYDCLTVIKKFLLTDRTDVLIAPPGMEIIDDLDIPSQLPPWITEKELQIYADKFQESGFTGGLNYYRAMDLTWELLAPWQGSKITVPSKFIIGDKDIGYKSFSKPYIEGNIMKTLVPDIEVVILDGGHHFIQHEKPQEVSDEIISFIQKVAKN